MVRPADGNNMGLSRALINANNAITIRSSTRVKPLMRTVVSDCPEGAGRSSIPVRDVGIVAITTGTPIRAV